MDGSGEAVADEAAHEVADALLVGEVDRRRRTVLAALNLAEIDGLAEIGAPGRGSAGKEDRLALGLEALGRSLRNRRWAASGGVQRRTRPATTIARPSADTTS